MADFFAVLAARSLGKLDSVQPRRVSRFEPGPGALAADPSDEMSLEQHIEQPASRTVDHAPQPARPVSRNRNPVSDGETATVDIPSSSHQRTDQFNRSRPLTTADHTEEPRSTPRPADVPLATGNRGHNERPTVGAEDDAANDRSLEFLNSPSPVKPQPVNPDPVQRSPHTVVKTEHAPRVQEPQQRKRDMLRLTTQPAPRDDEPLEIESRSSTVENGTPHVTVSIGRIEVKAPQQPSAPPSPLPVRSQPRLALDEYLQRSQRRRR